MAGNKTMIGGPVGGVSDNRRPSAVIDVGGVVDVDGVLCFAGSGIDDDDDAADLADIKPSGRAFRSPLAGPPPLPSAVLLSVPKSARDCMVEERFLCRTFRCVV